MHLLLLNYPNYPPEREAFRETTKLPVDSRVVTRRNRSDFSKPPYVDKTDIKYIHDAECFGGQTNPV